MFTPQLVKPPTSQDVASAAGVSRATVSFVLNDKPNARIPEETRKRVLDAAQRLGYTPNATARSLATSAVSGWLLVPPAVQSGWPVYDVLMRVAELGAEDGVDVLADVVRGTTGAEAARTWSRYRPQCVLAAADRCDEEATAALRYAGVQALLVYGQEPCDYAPCLVLPEAEYGRRAALRLCGLGHRRIDHVVPAGPEQDHAVRLRTGSARAVADEAGAQIRTVRAAASSASLRDWAHALSFERDRPTAVIAHDDRFAMAVIRALADAGLRCPQDVSVIGANDHVAASEFLPRLTTIAFDSEALASAIIDAFRTMLTGTRVERVTTPDLHVIERESVTQLVR
jgi:DNA-binding LacI/PurR family transcriptional regulator